MDDNALSLKIDRPAMLLVAGFLIALLAGPATSPCNAADEKKGGFGQILRLEGAASRGFYQDLKRTLAGLQREAEEKGEDAYLILELYKGPSTFGDVSDVVDLLSSRDYPRVTPVAWIPKETSVTGYNAIVALACRNIVMHPEAEIGDISEGKEISDRLRSTVSDAIKGSNNPKLNEALGMGLLDRGVTVSKVRIEKQKGVFETRVVTADDLRKLRAANAVMPEQPETIKDAGESGILSGRKAMALEVLVVTTRQSVDDVARYYGITLRRPVAATGKKKAALIKITGPIDWVLESFLNRQIDRCEQKGTNLIIFEITSPGGLLAPTMRLSQRIANLDPDKVRTVAYVPEMALSGAAIIAFGCDEVYMAPEAKIGDAGPIEVREGQPFERAPEKILGPLKVHLRELAKKKKRPPALLEAMADRNLVVYRVTHPKRSPTYMSEEELLRQEDKGWVKGLMVPESKKGDLLTLSGSRALDLKLASGVLNGKDRDAQMKNLKSELGLDPNQKLIALEPTWVDTFVFWLNSPWLTVGLLTLALTFIYLEAHFTTGLFGILAVLCVALFFWSRFLGGSAGWLEVILFVIGLGCIAMEIFVMPGFGVFGISGGILVVGSLVLASQTFGNLEPNADYHMLAGTMGRLAVSIVLVVAVAVGLSRYLPSMPLFGKLVLTPPGAKEAVADGPQLRPEFLDEKAMLVGQSGRTESVLRPAGKAVINGRMMDVVSDGPYIAEGSEIVVVSVSGNKVVVRSA